MPIDAANDSSFSDDRTPDPAAQAQAALLLVESLLHTLLDNGTLTKDQVLSTITGAAEVKADSAGEHKVPVSIRSQLSR